jgi:hypothetical protein
MEDTVRVQSNAIQGFSAVGDYGRAIAQAYLQGRWWLLLLLQVLRQVQMDQQLCVWQARMDPTM